MGFCEDIKKFCGVFFRFNVLLKQFLTSESVIKYLVMFQRSGGIISNFDARRETVEDTVAAQHRVTLRRDQHARLRVAKYIVLFENTLEN